MVSKNVKFLYVTTPHFNDPALTELLNGYLPKIIHASSAYDEKLDSSVLLDFLSQVVEH